MKVWIKSIAAALAFGIVFIGALLSLAWVANNFSLGQVVTGILVVFFGTIVVSIRYGLFAKD